MTRKDVMDKLNSLESMYPVDQWVVDDIHVWPIIKLNIFFKWFNNHQPKEQILANKQVNETIIQKIYKRIFSVSQLFKLLIQPRTQIEILFSGASSHRVDFEGIFINRYFQPMIDYINKDLHQEVILIDYNRKIQGKIYSPKSKLFFLEDYIYASRMISRFSNRRLKLSLPELNEFLKEVSDSLHLDLNTKKFRISILLLVKEIKVCALVYNLFLRKYNPKKIIGLCYYSAPMFALNYIAHKRGIPSIDMQHGGQGELHPAYSNFNKVPLTGYTTLPKIFWCWDSASAETIQDWTNKQQFHQVSVVGNPWIHYALSRSTMYDFPNKKIILFTLQFNHLEDYIIKAIKETPNEFQWWLRAHPRKKQEFKNVEVQLKDNNLLHLVNMQDATEWPLPIILSKSCVHISMYSGSIIEAEQLGIPNVIIDEVGVNSYEKLINENKAVACLSKDSNELLRKIVVASEKKLIENSISLSSSYRASI